MEVAFSEVIWFPQTTGEVPRRRREWRTDERGWFIRDSVTECDWPSWVYAWDVERELAGYTIIERAADLARPLTVHLQPARWVTGRLGSREADHLGFVPEAFFVELRPVHRGSAAARGLRYVRNGPGEFRFFVPAGDYRLNVQGSRLEWKRGIAIRVAAGAGPYDLGEMDLEASPLARLEGQQAPEWSIERWSDGGEHTLASCRGRYVVLCFWQKNSGAQSSLPKVFRTYEQIRGSQTAMVLIHPPEDGGLDAVQPYIEAACQAGEISELGADMKHWPFVVGIDRRVSGAVQVGGIDIGRSQEPYGLMGYPRFILIDPDGRVIADSTMPASRWEDALRQAGRGAP